MLFLDYTEKNGFIITDETNTIYSSSNDAINAVVIAIDNGYDLEDIDLHPTIVEKVIDELNSESDYIEDEICNYYSSEELVVAEADFGWD